MSISTSNVWWTGGIGGQTAYIPSSAGSGARGDDPTVFQRVLHRIFDNTLGLPQGIIGGLVDSYSTLREEEGAPVVVAVAATPFLFIARTIEGLGEAAVRIVTGEGRAEDYVDISMAALPFVGKLRRFGGALVERVAPPRGIPNAVRLTEVEQATAARLQAQTGLKLRESPHVGAEYVDQLGRTYDALGNPRAAQFWNEAQFTRSIDAHLRKSVDFTVIDLTEFKPEQINAVRTYINGLPNTAQSRIIRIGF